MQNSLFFFELILIFVLLILLSPKIIYRYKIYIRARSDYYRARGTYHLRQIKVPLEKLSEKINKIKYEESQSIAKIKNLKQERSNKLLEALTRFVVQGQFINIRGVGPALRERILTQCFDGTLQSLKRANGVRGIGGEKYYAVCQWISLAESKLPDLLNQDFPNKNSIIDEYNQLGLSLNINLKNTREEIAGLIALKDTSLKVKDELEKVRISHFIKSYSFNEEISKSVNNYLQGIFPEWEKIPNWYKTLISQYGD